MKRLTTISLARKAATKDRRGSVGGRRGSVAEFSLPSARWFVQPLFPSAKNPLHSGEPRRLGHETARGAENTRASLLLLKRRDCRNGRSVSLSPCPLNADVQASGPTGLSWPCEENETWKHAGVTRKRKVVAKRKR